jgi:hypothetical protein
MYPCIEPYYHRLRNFVNPHGLYDDQLEKRDRYQRTRRWNDRRIGNWMNNMQQEIDRPSPINTWLDGVSPEYGDRRVTFGCRPCYGRWGPDIHPYEPYDGYEAYYPYGRKYCQY